MKLKESTFILFAMQSYDNPHCQSTEEFEDDLKRIQYVRKLLKRYHNDGDLRERLILNHLTVLYNVFGRAATDMLFMKTEGYHSYLKPFVEFLCLMPETVTYGDKNILTSQIESDKYIEKKLKEI